MAAVTHPGSLSRVRPMPVQPARAPALEATPALSRFAAPRQEPWSEAQGPVEAAASQRSRYRGGGGRAPALVITIAIHALLLSLVLTARMAIERGASPKALATFDVLPPAPPPPDPAEPLPPASAAPARPIVAPPPVVEVPRPAPAVQSVAEIPPMPAPVVAKPPMVAAPAAPAPAPPAPVTPPDFSAAQLRNPGPAYPFLARKAREQGVVLLRVLVTEAGRAGEVRLQDSSGSPRLDEAAIATVKRWKFLPAKQAGKPVQAWVLVPITFKLG